MPGLFLMSVVLNSMVTPFFGDSIMNEAKGDMRRSLGGVGKYCFGNLLQADSVACKLFLEKYADMRTDEYLKSVAPPAKTEQPNLAIDLSAPY